MRKYSVILVVLFAALLSACVSTSFDVQVSDQEGPVEKDPNNKPGEINLDVIESSDAGFAFMNGLSVSDTFYKNESIDVSSFSRIDTIYEGYTDTSITTVVIVATVQGRWGPIEFAYAVDKTTDKIISFDVLSFSEKWGSFIDENNFKNQFVDMDLLHYEMNLFGLGVDGNADATTTINSVYAGLSQIIVMYKSNYN